MSLPKTFLDSNVAQAMMSFGAFIFDRVPSVRLDKLGGRLSEDIRALGDLSQLGTWYGWPVVVSSRVGGEHGRADRRRARRLLDWDGELKGSWFEWFVPGPEPKSQPACLGLHHALDANEPWAKWLLGRFPGKEDQHLLIDAICLGCDVFLTMDYRTIWGPSHRGPSLPLRIMRPCELLDEVTMRTFSKFTEQTAMASFGPRIPLQPGIHGSGGR